MQSASQSETMLLCYFSLLHTVDSWSCIPAPRYFAFAVFLSCRERSSVLELLFVTTVGLKASQRGIDVAGGFSLGMITAGPGTQVEWLLSSASASRLPGGL